VQGSYVGRRERLCSFKKIVCTVLIPKESEVIKRDGGLLNIISKISSWQLQRQCMQRGVVINVELVTPALYMPRSLVGRKVSRRFWPPSQPIALSFPEGEKKVHARTRLARAAEYKMIINCRP
jgi:hypothetical protein